MLMVLKFGGSSLADEEKIRAAALRIAAERKSGNQVVAVVSAQADTTDVLLKKAMSLVSDPNPRELDAYLSAGEQMSAGLMAMAVQALGQPAVSLNGWQAGITTEPRHGDARVLGLSNQRIRQELEQGKVVIVTGFQGVCRGDITTLGRGGSDTTAVMLAGLLKADICRIYTDVDGVYDKDPRKFADAVKFQQIDYEEMLRLAQSGAQVLHDRCVEAAMAYHVPIQVLSSFRPGEGTLVTKIPKEHTQNC